MISIELKILRYERIAGILQTIFEMYFRRCILDLIGTNECYHGFNCQLVSIGTGDKPLPDPIIIQLLTPICTPISSYFKWWLAIKHSPCSVSSHKYPWNIPVTWRPHVMNTFRITTTWARFIGPTWGPSGADRTRVAPCWPHELCSLGTPLWGGDIPLVTSGFPS